MDSHTKLVCCTGASNFLGTKPPLHAVREIADRSGYLQPTGERRSLLLVDGAQLVPSSRVDVQDLDVDYLSFSFHKFMAPFGVGVLYAKEHLLAGSLPFLYGGDMIAQGQVAPDHVGYGDLPWKYAAGTPNILGVIVSAQALRFAVDLVGAAGPVTYFRSTATVPQSAVAATMDAIGEHTRRLTARALDGLATVPGLTVYGPAAGGAALPAGGLHRDGVGSGQACGRAERGGRGIPGRVPLRHSCPSRPAPAARGQLPAQLLPLQHGA